MYWNVLYSNDKNFIKYYRHNYLWQSKWHLQTMQFNGLLKCSKYNIDVYEVSEKVTLMISTQYEG